MTSLTGAKRRGGHGPLPPGSGPDESAKETVSCFSSEQNRNCMHASSTRVEIQSLVLNKVRRPQKIVCCRNRGVQSMLSMARDAPQGGNKKTQGGGLICRYKFAVIS